MQGLVSRRAFIGGASAFGASTLLPQGVMGQATPDRGPLRTELVIDIDGPPDNLDPALTYSVRDWSILHSVYDALLHFGDDGELVPLLAEEFTTDDAKVFRVRLREGLTFHDGSPVTSDAIARAVEHLKTSKSQIADLFAGITEVRALDDLAAEIVCADPSPWLPSQVAVWLVLFPEGATPDALATAPVGTGPYRFGGLEPGMSVTLTRNPDYTWGSPKGIPLAEQVTFRFVPEAATRVADLTTGTAQLISQVPYDQTHAIEQGGGVVVTEPILGSAFVRIATDTPPFDDPRVGQALNLAVDVQAIAEALVGPGATRLASVFPDSRGLGFDADLPPFDYDPDAARALLAEAGLADGIDTTIQLVAGSRTDIVEAMVAQLAEVGIRLTIETVELAAFNQAWPDADAPPLRYATWRPFYDPHTFLSLVVDSGGFLSRYSNPGADELIRAAAAEPDPGMREVLYQRLGKLLQDAPAAIYLWNLTATYGLAPDITGWQPRGDEYLVPVAQGATS